MLAHRSLYCVALFYVCDAAAVHVTRLTPNLSHIYLFFPTLLKKGDVGILPQAQANGADEPQNAAA
jgi:hypothetical protein